MPDLGTLRVPFKNINLNSECLKSECSDFRQCRNPNKSQFGFQHVRISDIYDFWDTQNVRTVWKRDVTELSEIQTT